MNSEKKEAKFTRFYVLFEKKVDGEEMVFYNNGRKTSLPHLDIPDYVTDPEESIRSHFSKKYRLHPHKLVKVHEPEFDLWDEKIERNVGIKFYRADEFSGDFPPNAKFQPKDMVYEWMHSFDIEMGGESYQHEELSKELI